MDSDKKSPIVAFSPETDTCHKDSTVSRWKILITDDDLSIHDISATVLSDFVFKGIGIALFHAYSGQETLRFMEANPDTAVIILDISLEQQDTGLDLIHLIRKKLNNAITQIIICTGHPDYAPEQRIIEEYEINDYRVKTELTVQKWYSIITSSLRAYEIKSNLMKELQDRQAIEAQIKKSEERFRDIALSIGDWVWEIDARGNFSYSSGNPDSHAGFLITDLMEKHFSCMLGDRKNKNALKTISERIQARQPFNTIEIWRTQSNGQPSCFLSSARPMVDETGEFLGYRGVDKDITALKNAQMEKDALLSQLRQAQRLESIGTLAGGIAHDFNNILGAILGYTQILQLDVQANEKGMHYTRQIINGCNRAKNLILQILDFSRYNTKNCIKTPVAPSTVIKEALKLLRASLPSSIKIKTDISNDAGYILADASQIHHVIMNLCTNAYQAMEENQGTISITVKGIHIEAENSDHPKGYPPGEYVLVTVKDDGKGIEQDALEKIFEPYFSTRQGGDGTGLGLSVVHGIVTQSGGFLTVKSKPGEGSEFTLLFPRHNKNDPEEENAAAACFIKGEGKLLFVDDEQMLVDLGRSMLRRLGYNGIALNSATSALDMIKKNPADFDLVITDMTMPEMQGTQLAAKIKEIRPDLPVILVTGLSSIAETDKANAHNIDSLLSKPLSMNALAQAIHDILPQKR